MKGLRAGFKKGEAGALVVASAGPGGRGKATGREWSARGALRKHFRESPGREYASEVEGDRMYG